MLYDCGTVGVLRLNPYYTGSYSMRIAKTVYLIQKQSLNPYYTGSYSMREPPSPRPSTNSSGLNPYYTGSYSMSPVNLIFIE